MWAALLLWSCEPRLENLPTFTDTRQVQAVVATPAGAGYQNKFNPETGELEQPFSKPENLSVMAVDNLPCELPRNASRDFGRQFIDNVLPHLLNDDPEQIIERATITKNGKLTERYSYLADYVAGA